MSRTYSKAALAALVALPMLGAAPSAFAQDAILLEQIGAVRMAASSEAQHLNTESLWFADAYATAYYALDQRRHEVVVRIEAGPKGGNPTRLRRILANGAVERLAVDGTSKNRIRATLVVSRQGDVLTATVETGKRLDQADAAEPAASATRPTFYLPAVIGAAFNDARIATNPDEVRRQGGFASAGAVRWLQAAPKDVQATIGPVIKLGAL